MVPSVRSKLTELLSIDCQHTDYTCMGVCARMLYCKYHSELKELKISTIPICLSNKTVINITVDNIYNKAVAKRHMFSALRSFEKLMRLTS